jgi:hypothetical protein
MAWHYPLATLIKKALQMANILRIANPIHDAQQILPVLRALQGIQRIKNITDSLLQDITGRIIILATPYMDRRKG